MAAPESNMAPEIIKLAIGLTLKVFVIETRGFEHEESTERVSDVI
jgi:hypothetical protein